MNVVGQNLKENVRVKFVFSKIFMYGNLLFNSEYMKKIDNKMNTNELNQKQSNKFLVFLQLRFLNMKIKIKL